MKYHMVIKFSLMSHKLKLNFSGIEASVIRNYNQVYLIQKNQGGSAAAPLGPPAEKLKIIMKIIFINKLNIKYTIFTKSPPITNPKCSARWHFSTLTSPPAKIRNSK